MFKYATKELSQDAFICWCINWINYPDSNLYNLGKDMLNAIITDDKGKRKFEIKDDTKVKIIRQYASIDILLIVDNKYIVIIEDKINSFNHGQVSAKDNQKMIYKYKLINLLSNSENVEKDGTIKAKTDKEEIRNANKKCEELGLEEFKKSNITEVYFKTGKFDLIDNQVLANKINAYKILEVLEKYKNQSDIIKDFFDCIEFKLNLYDEEKVEKIIKEKKIDLNETFAKRYMIYNCFGIDVDENYTGKMNLRLKAGGIDLTDKTSIWTPLLYSNNSIQWKNKINENNDTITEISNSKKNLKTSNIYKYVFARRKDSFNDIYFEFLGVFYLDTKETTEEKRVWKKYDFKDNKITLDVNGIEKMLDKKLN